MNDKDIIHRFSGVSIKKCPKGQTGILLSLFLCPTLTMLEQNMVNENNCS
jgi:hypothetical protein